MEVVKMINDETKRKLRELHLDEMIQAFEEQDKYHSHYASLSFDDRLNAAVDYLYCTKNSVKTQKLIRSAKFRIPDADVNTLYYADRGLDRETIIEISIGTYFRNCCNILINGFTGSGKTHLGCALGKEACRHLYRTKYIRTPELLETLNLAEQQGKGISRLVTKISNYQLLILDEWLIDIPSEREQRYLLEIVEKRHHKWPTIFCSQYKTSEWHPRLGGGPVAEAIIDRIIHKSIKINTGTLNMREYTSKNIV